MKKNKLLFAALCPLLLGGFAHATEYTTRTVDGTLRTFPIITVHRNVTQNFIQNENDHSKRKGSVQKFMTPVENQGGLGTCATFASVGIVERYAHKALSEECLLRFRGGFDGSLPITVTKDIAKYGLVLPEVYEEKNKTFDCTYSDEVNDQDITEDEYVQLTTEHGQVGKGFQFENGNDTAVYDNNGTVIDAVLGDNGKSFPYIQKQIDAGNPIAIGVAIPDTWDTQKAFMGDGKHVIDATSTDSCNWVPVHPGMNIAQARCPGHAIILVGYDDDKKVFTFKNSWGTSWGFQGYGKISYNYIKNYRWGATTVVKKTK